MSEEMIRIGDQMVNEADYKAGRKLNPVSLEDYEKQKAKQKTTTKTVKAKK